MSPSTEKRFADIVLSALDPLAKPRGEGVPFTEDDHLVDGLGFDSLGLVELILAVEEEFEVDLPDEGLKEIETYGQALAHLKKILASSTSG